MSSGRDSIIHSFIHSTEMCAECDDSLLFSGASSIPLCYIPFPSTLFHQLVFHPPSLHLAIYFLVNLVASKFIYNTFLGILFSSILCTCPNQRNLFNLIVSVIAGFLTTAQILYQLITSNFLFHCHMLGLEIFYTLSFQKYLFGFYLSLLVSRFLMHML